MRAGAAGVPVAPLGETKTAEADRNRQWREVGVGAQILRDLGVGRIRIIAGREVDYVGVSGFGLTLEGTELLGD